VAGETHRRHAPIDAGPATKLAGARIAFRACPLCASAAFVAYWNATCDHHPLYQPALPSLMHWQRCSQCAHVFIDGHWSDEALAIIFASENPHQMPGSDVHRSRGIAARMVERVLPHVLGAPGTWLDVGFGNGALLGAAEEYGFTPIGIDLRTQAVAALNAYGIEAHSRDFSTFERPGGVQVISFADVLEHMPFPQHALAHAHAQLAAGGLLFASMPNLDCHAWKVLDHARTNPYWGELEHYHNFGRQRLEALLREQGFEPLSYGISERYYLCMEIVARRV
jgi:SAM-dependent methyltransferase